MNKTLTLALNKINPVPNSLRTMPANNVARAEVAINLASLYHHYYLDSYGQVPPNPDPSQFEYFPFFLPTTEFRFKGDSLGASTVMRRHTSTTLGQAFCRMMLHDHFGINYFAHMADVLDRPLHPAFSSITVKRISDGDAPDYFCAEGVNKVFLSEAKGRYHSISFANAEFTTWRNQFSRVAIQESGSGMFRKVKGYIVATRWATETKARIKPRVAIEDPESPGEEFLTEEQTSQLGEVVVSHHYSNIARKLGQPLLAAALSTGVPLPEDIRVNLLVWRVVAGPLQDRRFVGGYYPSGEGRAPFQIVDGQYMHQPFAPFRLDLGTGVFVGVEESIFENVVKSARSSSAVLRRIDHVEENLLRPFYSAFSLLRDGSVLATVDFFAPVEQISL
jgi:hypothetical protein